MTFGMWIAALIAVLCLCGLGYLLTRKEPQTKPEGPRERAPEWHSADEPIPLAMYRDTDGRVGVLVPADTFIQAGEPVMDRKPKFEVYKAKKGYRWRLLSANGRTLCSGESHTRARDAARAARTVIETAAIADVVHASRPGN